MHVVPKETSKFLLRFGGENPFGKPNWRVIVSADRLVREAGVYRDWADGLSTTERGGLNFTPSKDVPGMNFQRYDNKPIRVVTEIREVQKYPDIEGWLLEKWWPASQYGTRDEWYSYKAADGITPMLGAYPEDGDYEFLFGPWPKIPPVSELQTFISAYSAQIANKRGTPESRAREYMLRFEYLRLQAEEKRKTEYNAWFRDELSPMKSGSLEASRWRQELAKRVGRRSHVGIE